MVVTVFVFAVAASTAFAPVRAADAVGPKPADLVAAVAPSMVRVELELQYDKGEAPTGAMDLVGECRGVVLAIIAAHRWSRDDQHPSGRQSGVAFLNALREGPPWPPLNTV